MSRASEPSRFAVRHCLCRFLCHVVLRCWFSCRHFLLGQCVPRPRSIDEHGSVIGAVCSELG